MEHINHKRHAIALSVVIIAKNEEARIAKAIESVKFADEIIVIDNGSTDQMARKAKRCGAKVVPFHTNSFAQLRDYGATVARGAWLLYLDADERITALLAAEIRSVTKNPLDPKHLENETVCYFIQRQNQYLGHTWPTMDRMQRLFFRAALIRWEGAVHETAIVTGKTSALTHWLSHDTHRSLEEMLSKTNEWSKTEAMLRYKANHPPVVWWRLLRVMLTGFWRSYIQEGGYKAGTVGIIESLYQGFSMFVTYAKLWEMQKETETS